jgi:hypothetical protein
MGGIERLRLAVQRSQGRRFWVWYGTGVDDVYCNRRGRELKFDQALYEALVEAGYERIVFFAPHRSIYVRWPWRSPRRLSGWRPAR